MNEDWGIGSQRYGWSFNCSLVLGFSFSIACLSIFSYKFCTFLEPSTTPITLRLFYSGGNKSFREMVFGGCPNCFLLVGSVLLASDTSKCSFRFSLLLLCVLPRAFSLFNLELSIVMLTLLTTSCFLFSKLWSTSLAPIKFYFSASILGRYSNALVWFIYRR